jgi:hypothetical protein
VDLACKESCFASICSSLAVFITRSTTLGVIDHDASHDRQLLIAWASEPRPKKEAIMSDKGELASEPWTVERALHLALAAVAILGWAIAYATVMQQIEPPQDITRESPRTNVSVSATFQTPDIAPSTRGELWPPS